MNLQQRPLNLFPVAEVDWEQVVTEYRAADKAKTSRAFPLSRIAEAVRYMTANLHMSQQEVAVRFARSTGWVSPAKQFFRLTKEAQFFFGPATAEEARLKIDDLRIVVQAPAEKQAERARNLSTVRLRGIQKRLNASCGN